MGALGRGDGLLYLLTAMWASGHFWCTFTSATIDNSDTKEYCLTERFEASCKRGQVIVFESARFGRMGLGRCVARNYGYLGCATKVLGLVDSRCSGRPTCSFSIADPTVGILGTSPCPKDFSSYFEAKYSCLQVPTCERAQCESSSFLHLRSSEGHLSSWVTATNGCGSASCPWVVEALPGQRINITLFDFSISARNTSNSLSSKLRPGYPLYCHEYAVIKETEVPRSTTICGGDYRERVAYVSSSNKVEVTMISRKLGATVEYFLLQYKAVGCPTLVPPKDGWVQRLDDKGIIKCNHSRESWSMVCRGTEWIGEMRNCTGTRMDEQPWSIEGVVAGMGLPSVGVSVLIIFGVAMVVVIYIAVSIVCVFYFRRRRRRDAARRSMVDQAVLDEGLDRNHRPNMEGYEERIPMLIKNGKAFRRADGEYADICELQLLGHSGTCLAEVKDGAFKGQCQGARTVSQADGGGGGGGGGGVGGEGGHPQNQNHSLPQQQQQPPQQLQQQQHPGTTEKCMTISGHGATLRTFRVPKDPSHIYECPAARHQAAVAAAAAASSGTLARPGSGLPSAAAHARGQHYHELDPSMLHNYGLSPADGILLAAADRHIRYLPDLMPEAAVENASNTMRDQPR